MYIPTDDGRWVSEHFARLAEVIKDYDPQFELRWIPPEYRETPEDRKNCYVVWDTYSNYPVFHAGELDTPESILGRLFDSDNRNGDVLKRIDAHNAAIEALQLKEELDRREEQQDYAAWLAGTNKNYIKLKGGRVVDDQLRRIR